MEKLKITTEDLLQYLDEMKAAMIESILRYYGGCHG